MSIAVSIIIPIYNCEKYLHRCLQSVLAQTFTDYEVILINDGSTDRSEEICREYEKNDCRFVLYSQTNKGQATARNVGIQHARGEWVHFIDADDAIHPQMLELLYNAAVQTNANLSMCGFTEGHRLPESFLHPMSPQRQDRHTSAEADLQDLFLHGDKKYWVVWGKLIKKAIAASYPFTDGRIYEDNAVICKWLYHSGSYVDIHETLYFYYVNPDSTSRAVFSPKQLDRIWALSEQSQFYQSIGYNTMRRLIDVRFLLAAAKSYQSANQKKLKREIRKLFYQKILSLHYIPQLTATELIFISESFHPKIMQLYWIAKKYLTLFWRKTYE